MDERHWIDMTIFLLILCVVGWTLAFGLFGLMGIVAQILASHKAQIAVLEQMNEELRKKVPVDWNQWIHPYE